MTRLGLPATIRRLRSAALLAAICICLCTRTASANALGVPDSEYNALVALYNSTGGNNWTARTNWLTSKTPWYGVSVSGAHVASLSLSSNQLTGSMPASLGNLANLHDLYLNNNQLAGSIPTELGSLANLHVLSLTGNQLTGSIPGSLGSLTNLYDLYLYGNQLTGTIPGSLGSLANLHYLDLCGNQLSGSMPTELGNLTNLEYLSLSGNRLTGSMPASLGSLANLQYLDLWGNQLTGSIPTSLCNLANLQYLDLWGNQLTGSIPTCLGNLANLQYLYLSGNQLTGTIPVSLGSLANLQGLSLFHNQLTGSIPVSLGNLARLGYLSLSSNQLTGPIPACLGNLMSLQYLDLWGNRLSGSIPASLGNLANLEYLGLYGNQLTGSIPASLGNLANLQGGSLSYNGLSCSDPALQAFLAAKFPSWQSTQTVPPTNVSATLTGPGTVTVWWTPIIYTADSGYYEVGCSSTSGGPYAFDPANRTQDKRQSSLTLTGQGAGSPLFVVVRTVTLAGWQNQSTLTSLPSPEVMAIPPSRDKRGPDSASIEYRAMILSATFPDCRYFQTSDRSWGVNVVGSANLTGNRADITGTLRTGSNGERYVDAGSITDAADPPKPGEPNHAVPLGMPNRIVGGTDRFYDPGTGAGQRGITGGKGLNNIGLLVRTWGRVTYAGRHYFYIDDGSYVSDGTGVMGIYCETPSGASPPAVGSYVSATGASSCEFYGGNLVNILRVRNQADIVVLRAPSLGDALAMIPSGDVRPRDRARTE